MAIRIQRARIDNFNMAQRENKELCANTLVQNKSQNPSFKGITVEVNGKNFFKAIRWMGTSDKFTSAHNRLLMGFTALMTQPFFDLYNKKVDDKTRTVSCARTLSKIIAGTSVGVMVRYLCIRACESFTKLDFKKVEGKGLKNFWANHHSWFVPETKDVITIAKMKKYRSILGTFIATAVMIGTNFWFDAPITKFLTNKFNNKFEKAGIAKLKEEQKAQGGQK